MEEEIQQQDGGLPEDIKEGSVKEEAQKIDKHQVLLGVLKDMKENLENAINILGGMGVKKVQVNIWGEDRGEARILEGVFAGDKMVGSDGQTYNIPLNYASKSKLVEGDILKLTVTSSGNFIYKQIGPTPRKRVIGELVVDEEKDEYWVASDTNKWRILKASATFFKGCSGDKVTFLVPEEDRSKWAAVENIMKEDMEI